MVTLAVLSTKNLESQAARSLITLVLLALLMTAGVLIFRGTIVRFYRRQFPVVDNRNTVIATVIVGVVLLGGLVAISSDGAVLPV